MHIQPLEDIAFMEHLHDSKALKYYINKYGISGAFLNDMTEYMVLHSFSKGEHIFRANEKIEYLYFMVDGKAKVYTLLKNGKSLLIRFYKPFTVLGDVELTGRLAAVSNTEVISPAVCIGISYKNLQAHAADDPVFLKFICRSLGEKLAKNSMTSSINLLYPLENRLASYILAIAPGNKSASSFDEIYTEKLTELADLLGTSYRHLMRTINALSMNKVIEKRNNKIIILDHMSLEKLAGDVYE